MEIFVIIRQVCWLMTKIRIIPYLNVKNAGLMLTIGC
jgi:hypothetical protein